MFRSVLGESVERRTNIVQFNFVVLDTLRGSCQSMRSIRTFNKGRLVPPSASISICTDSCGGWRDALGNVGSVKGSHVFLKASRDEAQAGDATLVGVDYGWPVQTFLQGCEPCKDHTRVVKSCGRPWITRRSIPKRTARSAHVLCIQQCQGMGWLRGSGWVLRPCERATGRRHHQRWSSAADGPAQP